MKLKELKNKTINFNIKKFIICFILIVIAYIPYLINYYPGIIISDITSQTKQALGLIPLSNHHPVFHTFLIFLTLKVGQLFRDYNIGFVIYCIFQIISMAFVFTLSIKYLANKKVPLYFLIIILLIYMLYPIFAVYSVYVTKDTLFGVAVLMYTIFLEKYLSDREEFINSKTLKTLFIFSSIFVILTKNNGLYIIIFSLIYMLILERKNIKKFLPIIFSIIIFFILYKNVLFPILHIENENIKDMMSIPCQQIARIVKFENNKLSKEDKEQILNFFTTKNIEDSYIPYNSDPIVKKILNSEYLEKHKFEFIKLSIKLFIKFPKESFISFGLKTHKYYIYNKSYFLPPFKIKNIDDFPVNINLPKKNINIINELFYLEKHPIINTFYSPAIVFYLTAIFCLYNIFKRKNFLIFIPSLTVWLTTLAGPANGLIRYVFPMYICLPFLIGVSLYKKTYSKNKSNDS